MSAEPHFPWPGMIQVESGGWMYLEDYCNSQPKGNGFVIAGRMLCARDEDNAIELGIHAANVIMEQETTGWDPLMDAIYQEEARDQSQRERWGQSRSASLRQHGLH